MFLIDKYYQDSTSILYHHKILHRLLDSFNIHSQIYKNINSIVKKPYNEIRDIILNMENGAWKYANFPHLLVYGPEGCGKEYIIKNLLEKIFGKKSIEVNEVEYTISGYSNTKTKVLIKQSNHHIIIEPNNNGFDKYLIQEIIEDYAKTEILSILKYKKLFKVVIINLIDNLSYYAQASLRRTMEKYANTCKFIFISNQLSKINEPLKSRCLLIRVPLPTNEMILNVILNISTKEQITLSMNDIKDIMVNSDNNIDKTIWLLEVKKCKITDTSNWTDILHKIVTIVTTKENYTTVNMLDLIKDMRELLYILFITNIDFHIIIRKLLLLLLKKIDGIKNKYELVSITSKFEYRISQGTRQIIHMEAYLIQVINLINIINL
jgi:replication factor C subunit 3/5